MCDCYFAKCAHCGCDISLHITDFCTDRKNVFPFCHRCTRKIKQGKLKPPANCQCFCDEAGKVCDGEIQGIRCGDKVHIYCDDKKAYGIHLN